jgi:putative MATE family efflux protein
MKLTICKISEALIVNKTVHLTSGSIDKHLLRLSIPLLACNIIQQLYNTINTLVVGRYIGATAFETLGVAGPVMNLFLNLIVGLCSGFAVLFAQAFGEGDYAKLRRALFTSTVIGILFTLLLMIVGTVFLTPILHFIQTPDLLVPYCHTYLIIIFCGLLFSLCYNLLSSVLRSAGNTKAAMIFLLISLGCNILLAYVFVAVFHWGITGTAFATLISQAIAAILCAIYLLRDMQFLRFQREDMHIRRETLKTASNYSFISAMQKSSLYIGKLLIQGVVNSLGVNVIAAFTAVTCVENLVLAFGDSGAEAISVFEAQNYGHDEFERIRQGLRHGLKLLVIAGSALSLLYGSAVKNFYPSFFPEATGKRCALGSAILI